MIELKRFVERVVRPVPIADVWRKLRLREELYAHLLEAYQFELSKSGDEAEAQSRAIARMGDASELTAELSSNVSRVNRMVYWVSSRICPIPFEPVGTLAKRVGWIMSEIMLLTFLGVCILRYSEIITGTPNGKIIFRHVLSLCCCVSVGAYLVTIWAEVAIRKVLTLTSRLATAEFLSLMGVKYLIFFLGLGMMQYLVTSWAIADWKIAFSSMLPSAIALSVLAVGTIIATVKERRALDPWLELELGS